ncbi:hypothetical protein KBP30_19270 [Streptomyces sp. Go40/10]|uniref:hypothetical protein n=1 Tax=Streptomyces sp. Go40/10 TaxID=2825844 RepID=UPI001E5EF0E5|nr:hypothetical protein [Streptomyces sp. Go40/10]UFR03190.1 hypothetical protein KBP30_19270 [Streptomyces sp. Go40/10]
MADLVGLLQILGAGSVGGLVTQYVSAGPERRQARAAARSAMSALEEAVWSEGRQEEWAKLRSAQHAFEAAALIAGVPQEVSDWYVKTRAAIYMESRRSWEQYPDPEYGGGVNVKYLRALNEATALVYEALWHPHRSKLLWRRRLKAARARGRAVVADSSVALRALEDD